MKFPIHHLGNPNLICYFHIPGIISDDFGYRVSKADKKEGKIFDYFTTFILFCIPTKYLNLQIKYIYESNFVMSPVKRKLAVQSLAEKGNILRDLEKGLSK